MKLSRQLAQFPSTKLRFKMSHDRDRNYFHIMNNEDNKLYFIYPSIFFLSLSGSAFLCRLFPAVRSVGCAAAECHQSIQNVPCNFSVHLGAEHFVQLLLLRCMAVVGVGTIDILFCLCMQHDKKHGIGEKFPFG